MHGKVGFHARSFSAAGEPLHQIRSRIAANLAALQLVVRQSQQTIEEAREALRNADRALGGARAGSTSPSALAPRANSSELA
jgi:hypothetical protein